MFGQPSAMKSLRQIPSDYKKLPDEELVFRYVSRHEEMALSCLFERYGHLVFGVFLKYQKNELPAKRSTEDLFIRLSNELRTFKADNFKEWLFDLVQDQCHVENETCGHIKPDEYWLNQPAQTRLLSKIETAAAHLQGKEREYLDLFYLQGLNYKEIAEQTGNDILQVKTVLKKAKDELKIKMETLQNG